MPHPKKNRRRVTQQNTDRKYGVALQSVHPKTQNQERAFQSFEDGKHLLLHGMAGSGKTFLSLYLAFAEIFANQPSYNNVIIIRSVVPTRDMGFLPGKEKDKIAAYETPYKDICSELFDRGDAYDILKTRKTIEFMPTSFIRGLTFRDSIVIVDEFQNCNFHESDSILTRIGDNCRVIFCGDFRQSDLVRSSERQGIHDFMKILERMKDFAFIEFGENDILRSDLVKQYIIERERLGFCA